MSTVTESHTYTGPSTLWGLGHGAKGTIIGKRAGGVSFKRAKDGKVFTVGKHEVEKVKKDE
jgi:hypothetical protein